MLACSMYTPYGSGLSELLTLDTVPVTGNLETLVVLAGVKVG